MMAVHKPFVCPRGKVDEICYICNSHLLKGNVERKVNNGRISRSMSDCNDNNRDQ